MKTLELLNKLMLLFTFSGNYLLFIHSFIRLFISGEFGRSVSNLNKIFFFKSDLRNSRIKSNKTEKRIEEKKIKTETNSVSTQLE